MADATMQYFTALGYFVDKFAQTEKLLAICLWNLSGTSIEKAKALFSGVRTDAATGYITRILTATNAPQNAKDEYQYLFSHLGHITKLRNSIMHYGTEFNDTEQYKTSNRFVALTPERIEERPVSAEILWAVGHDLDRINWRLAAEMSRDEPIPREFFTGVPAWNAPWRYTPPTQGSRGDKTPA
jgi:hypothetical protein